MDLRCVTQSLALLSAFGASASGARTASIGLVAAEDGPASAKHDGLLTLQYFGKTAELELYNDCKTCARPCCETLSSGCSTLLCTGCMLVFFFLDKTWYDSQ